MSRKQHDLTVNTGGEMGQILDHLLCASDPKIRRQDARDALQLHAALRAALAAAERRAEEAEKLAALHDSQAEMYSDEVRRLTEALASERAARVAAERERDEARALGREAVAAITHRATAAESSLSRAVEALRPFAEFAAALPAGWEDDELFHALHWSRGSARLSNGDLRRARAVLAEVGK